MCTRIHFANILLTIYGSIFIRNGGQAFSFPVFLSDIDIKLMLMSQNQSGSGLSFSVCWKHLRRIGVKSSLKVDTIHQGNDLITRFSMWEVFNY